MQPLLFHHLRNYPPVEKPFPVVRRLYQGTASDVPKSSGKKSGFSPCRGDRQEPNENVQNEPIFFDATRTNESRSFWLRSEPICRYI